MVTHQQDGSAQNNINDLEDANTTAAQILKLLSLQQQNHQQQKQQDKQQQYNHKKTSTFDRENKHSTDKLTHTNGCKNIISDDERRNKLTEGMNLKEFTSNIV